MQVPTSVPPRGDGGGARGRRSPGGTEVGNRRDRAIEARALFAEERRLGIVGGGEVGVNRLELEVRAREQTGQRPLEVVEAETETVHAGIDLQVIPQRHSVFRGRRLHGLRGARRGDRRRETAVEQPVEIADAECAEHQNLRAHARLPQRVPLFDVRAGEQIRAGVLERACDLSGAVAVGVRFDDRDDARRADRVALQMIDDGAVVGLQRAEIDPRDGRSDHAAPAARFSNRVNSRMNASLTTPVGPLRCLPTMSSATPWLSAGACVLSAY